VSVPNKGEVLIKIMAAGMIRSEMFTRQSGWAVSVLDSVGSFFAYWAPPYNEMERFRRDYVLDDADRLQATLPTSSSPASSASKRPASLRPVQAAGSPLATASSPA
jgi:hypothetical protein